MRGPILAARSSPWLVGDPSAAARDRCNASAPISPRTARWDPRRSPEVGDYVAGGVDVPVLLPGAVPVGPPERPLLRVPVVSKLRDIEARPRDAGQAVAEVAAGYPAYWSLTTLIGGSRRTRSPTPAAAHPQARSPSSNSPAAFWGRRRSPVERASRAADGYPRDSAAGRSRPCPQQVIV